MRSNFGSDSITATSPLAVVHSAIRRTARPVIVALTLTSLAVGCGSSAADEADAGAPQEVEAGAEQGTDSDQSQSDSNINGDSAKEGELATEQFRTVSWDFALANGPRLVEIGFVGGPIGPLEDDPCNHQYVIDVVETTDDITFTVNEIRLVNPPALNSEEGSGCNDVGYEHRLAAQLSNPPGQRIVIDGHDETTRTIIDEAAFLVPGWLPDGWTEQYRRADGDRFEIAYGDGTHSGLAPLTLIISPLNDRTLNMASIRTRDMTEAIDLGVRGAQGNAIQVTSFEDGSVTVAFVEGELLYQVLLEDALLTATGLRFIEELQQQVVTDLNGEPLDQGGPIGEDE